MYLLIAHQIHFAISPFWTKSKNIFHYLKLNKPPFYSHWASCDQCWDARERGTNCITLVLRCSLICFDVLVPLGFPVLSEKLFLMEKKATARRIKSITFCIVMLTLITITAHTIQSPPHTPLHITTRSWKSTQSNRHHTTVLTEGQEGYRQMAALQQDPLRFLSGAGSYGRVLQRTSSRTPRAS